MLKRIIVTIRDFCYLREKKQTRKDTEVDYNLKFAGFVAPYYIAVLILVVKTLQEAGLLPSLTNRYGIFVRLIAGLVIVYLPLMQIVKFLNSWLEDIPFPEDLSKRDAARITTTAMTVLIFGLCLMAFLVRAVQKPYLF